MTFYHIAGIVLGIGMAIAGAYYLIKEIGYDGSYFDEFFISLIIQALFVGGVCLALWGATWFRIEFLYAAVVVSFLLPAAGVVMFRLPEWKQHKARKNLRSAIMDGPKYRSFSAFVKKNGDRIMWMSKRGDVRYALGDAPLFVQSDNGYEITWVPNPELSDAKLAKAGEGTPRNSHWETIHFFAVQEGERGWDYWEERILEELVEEALPGGKDKWYLEYDDHGYRRKEPDPIQKKKRKNPY